MHSDEKQSWCESKSKIFIKYIHYRWLLNLWYCRDFCKSLLWFGGIGFKAPELFLVGIVTMVTTMQKREKKNIYILILL